MDPWAIIGAIATAVTALIALVAAWMALGQLRLLVRQSQLGQELAYAQATRDSMIHQQSVLDHFMALPELRKYIFEGAVPPPDDHELVGRIAVMADMQLELHECSLEMANGLNEFSVNYLDWRTSARSLWDGCFAIREAACAEPSIYDDFLRAVHSEDPPVPGDRKSVV